jgi:hypothetical protein
LAPDRNVVPRRATHASTHRYTNPRRRALQFPDWLVKLLTPLNTHTATKITGFRILIERSREHLSSVI